MLRQLSIALNTPFTSSVGRLFDAAASLAGVRQRINFEAQAAIEFEALLDPDEQAGYTFEYDAGVIDPAPMWRQLIADRRAGVSAGKISARFHNGLAALVVEVCLALRRQAGLNIVALSGGVWQNICLLERTIGGLEKGGFEVLIHRQVPANDGGVALGQAAVASAQIAAGDPAIQ
jgi:hydrogenase maturation protein HypF